MPLKISKFNLEMNLFITEEVYENVCLWLFGVFLNKWLHKLLRLPCPFLVIRSKHVIF